MQRIGSALFLFIPAILLIFMFPQKISAGRSCSLTVHSYVSQCGDENDGTYADGQNVPDDASPLSGADYSLWKVGDVTTQNLDGTVTICACHINDEFLKLLIPGGLSPDIGSGEQEPFYQLADIQDAWNKAVRDETELTELVKSNGSTLPSSDIDGETRADDLAEGLYVLAITHVPDRDDLRILSGHAPILLMLPQINTAEINIEGEVSDPDHLWIYDVSVYPKSRTLESGKKILLSDMTLRDADDRETGSTISFISYINLPNPGDSCNYDEAVLDDNMTGGLYYKEIKKVVCGAWLSEEALSYDVLDTYKELSPLSDYTVKVTEHGFRLSLTDQGLDKINELSYNRGLYVIYNALHGSDAAVGTEGPETNESIWAVSTDRTHESYTLRSPLVRASSYGIDLIKEGLSDASQARFCIRRGNDLMYFSKTGEGTYTAQGTTALENTISSLPPEPDGHLRIRGLDTASYTIVETKTETGHSLLSSPITITLTGDPAAGTLTEAVLSLGSTDPIPLSISPVNGGVAEISVSNEAAITPLKAGDNGYWKVAACIFTFGIMLLRALSIRKSRLHRCNGYPSADDLTNEAERPDAAEEKNEKTQEQSTEESV